MAKMQDEPIVATGLLFSAKSNYQNRQDLLISQKKSRKMLTITSSDEEG
jgi:hypothetical protein